MEKKKRERECEGETCRRQPARERGKKGGSEHWAEVLSFSVNF